VTRYAILHSSELEAVEGSFLSCSFNTFGGILSHRNSRAPIRSLPRNETGNGGRA